MTYIYVVRRLTVKNTNINIAFRSTNTIYHQLQHRLNREPSELSGIYSYKLQCMTCNKFYVGQSGRTIAVRYKEHIRYIRTNSLTSAYALHVLNQRHEYGTLDNKLHLLKPCKKGNLMNCWESFYTQQLQHLNLLIDEQQPQELNPLYALSWEAQQTKARQPDTQAT
jgi:energy-converting hydrogenase A subunit M